MKLKMLALVLAGTLMTAPAFAAKFHSIEKPSNAFLAETLTAFKAETAKHPTQLDAASLVVKIEFKKPSERIENTIKQVLHNQYVEEVSATRTRFADGDIFAAIKELLNAYGLNPEREGSDAFEAISQPLIDACDGESDISLFTGNISGAFDSSYVFMALVDNAKQEILVLSTGYSE